MSDIQKHYIEINIPKKNRVLPDISIQKSKKKNFKSNL